MWLNVMGGGAKSKNSICRAKFRISTQNRSTFSTLSNCCFFEGLFRIKMHVEEQNRAHQVFYRYILPQGKWLYDCPTQWHPTMWHFLNNLNCKSPVLWLSRETMVYNFKLREPSLFPFLSWGGGFNLKKTQHYLEGILFGFLLDIFEEIKIF